MLTTKLVDQKHYETFLDNFATFQNAKGHLFNCMREDSFDFTIRTLRDYEKYDILTIVSGDGATCTAVPPVLIGDIMAEVWADVKEYVTAKLEVTSPAICEGRVVVKYYPDEVKGLGPSLGFVYEAIRNIVPEEYVKAEEVSKPGSIVLTIAYTPE